MPSPGLTAPFKPRAGHSVDLPVVFTREVGGEPDLPLAGRVVRLSPRECRLESDRPLEAGERITLHLEARYARPGEVTVRGSGKAVYGRVMSPEGAADAQRVGAAGEDPDAVYAYAVHFEQDLDLANVRFLERMIPVAGILVFAAIIVTVLCLKFHNVSQFWDWPLLNAYSLLVAVYILSRFSIAGLYRPPRATGFCPTITVIIAAKDEETSIGRTLDYIFLCEYPRERLEVIAVDDGSTDGTFREMESARERHPGLRLIRFPKNRGKRHAMAEGVRQASGEILVFVDSDTFLHRDALRRLVRGFAEPSVGAVCGHAFVQNARESHLTRMQEVRYYVSFRVLKGAESVLGTVMCCSGCLSAYRRSAVLEVLEPWLHQRFLGTEATFGDDRSLTNHVLRKHRVIYDSEAVCTTIAPTEPRKFFRQQLRWKKSWLRESLIASGFLWRRHPLAALFFYMQVIISLVSPLCVLMMLLLPILGIGHFSALYAAGVFLVALLYGLFYLIRFRDGLWVYGVLVQFSYSIALSWQNYYAFATVRRNHWGTR